MKNPDKNAVPYMGSVRVGPKGQIVIPKEVRDMFGVEPGDSLVLLAHPKKGIALERPSLFAKLAEQIFAGNPDSKLHDEDLDTPPQTEELQTFAKMITKVLSTEPESDK